MLQRTELLNRPSLTMLWLGATIGAVVLGFSLAASLSYQDGIYWFIAVVDIVVSFVFYPFGVLQFIFLNLVGVFASLDEAQLFTPIKILGLAVVFRRLTDLTFRGGVLGVVKASQAVWALLFVLSLGPSIFASANTPESLGRFLTYVQLLIMFLLIVDFVRGEREMKWLLVVLILGGMVNAGFAIYQSYFENRARVEGMIGNANEFGIIELVVLCLIAPFLGSSSVRWLSPVALLALGQIAYSILLSFSRGTFIAAAAVILYYLLFLRSGGGRSKVVLVAVIIAGLVLAPEGFYDRIETIPAALSGTRLPESSAPTRILYLSAGIRMGLDHLITGVGLRQFDHYVSSYANLHRVLGLGAHNMYVSVFAEAGSISLIAFLGFLGTSFMAARRHRASLPERNLQMVFASGVELGNVALLIGGLTGTLEYSKILWILLALATALSVSICNKKNDD